MQLKEYFEEELRVLHLNFKFYFTSKDMAFSVIIS